MGMRIQGLASGIAIVATSLSAAVFGDAHAQSAGADAEIAALKQQLRLMEQKLDKLQRQTAANTAAAATANAKADTKVSVANAAAYPVKSQTAPLMRS
jgi:phosphate-selective porin OprO and OprP